MGAADARRRIRALQRRESAEIAAVSIQRVVRGRVARATVEAEVARREVGEKEERGGGGKRERRGEGRREGDRERDRERDNPRRKILCARNS